ncbi:glutamine amidotransferase, putative [Brucella melitensis M28]|nr:glutamine amidotransferase, putative [Brucella melitensis M28]
MNDLSGIIGPASHLGTGSKMCRWAAYLGPETYLEDNYIVSQSFARGAKP